MPARSDRLNEASDAAGEYELPYVSKSRLMSWTKNPEHFRFKYLEDVREPETDAMVRGTRIHETIEHYYRERLEEPSKTIFDEGMLPADRQMWADFIEPYLTNFAAWEHRRYKEADENAAAFLPYGIEEEAWRDDIMEDGPEWMGLADVILPVSSIAEVPEDSGAVVVDFKTGKVPKEKYRDTGIYSELAYYELLFEDRYDVVAGAAYYPKENELLVRPDGAHKKHVLEEGRDMIEHVADYEGDSKFPHNEGPLCKWGFGDDEESAFYGICSKCTWGAPAKNRNAFEQMIEEGYSNKEIAEELGCSPNAVGYWKYKVNQ